MHLKMSSAKWRPSCLGLDVKTADSEIYVDYPYFADYPW